jgi:hypothetical protein
MAREPDADVAFCCPVALLALSEPLRSPGLLLLQERSSHSEKALLQLYQLDSQAPIP